ncbi:MAG: hypothetical protein OEY19_04285 [Gammaproteobacteria bacterium]|nr:hypothetical protein [Gammaproteobacteria bacterium]MDH5629627.1 hypothetical protein [Gammaproteobacteria bacterium]
MTKNYIVMAVIALSSFTGCYDDDKKNPCSGFIWKQDSQRLEIIQSGGITGTIFPLVDAVRDTLSQSALDKLQQIQTVPPQNCIADGFQYDLTITNSMGMSCEYKNNTAACGDTGSLLFVKDSDIEELVDIINTP